MSKIAAALVLSRELALLYPGLPETPEADPVVAETAPSSPKRSKLRLVVIIAGGVCSVAVAGLFLWLLVREEEPASHLAPRRWARRTAAKVLHLAPPPEPAPVPVAAPAALPPPSGELIRLVQSLAISAVNRGAQPRVSIAGKVYYPGDAVATGLFLHEINDDQLLFRDEAGNIYPRRF